MNVTPEEKALLDEAAPLLLGLLRELRKKRIVMAESTERGAVVGASQIIQTLKEERVRQGVRMTHMAEALGMSRASLSALEAGRAKNPHLKTLIKWCDVLGYEVTIHKKKDGGP